MGLGGGFRHCLLEQGGFRPSSGQMKHIILGRLLAIGDPFRSISEIFFRCGTLLKYLSYYFDRKICNKGFFFFNTIKDVLKRRNYLFS